MLCSMSESTSNAWFSRPARLVDSLLGLLFDVLGPAWSTDRDRCGGCLPCLLGLSRWDLFCPPLSPSYAWE